MKSMNAIFQGGETGHPISAQKMDMCRTGFPVVTMPTAIKRDVITMTNSAGRSSARGPRVHLGIAIKKSTHRETVLATAV